jgi:hypothetical protein
MMLPIVGDLIWSGYWRMVRWMPIAPFRLGHHVLRHRTAGSDR